MQTAPARIIYTKRDGIVRAGIVAQNWYFAGLLEGFVMSQEISNHLSYAHRHYAASSSGWEKLTGQKLAPISDLIKFFQAQAKQLELPSHPLSQSLSNVTDHLKGIVEGHNMRFHALIDSKEMTSLELADLLLLNSFSELLDIGAKATGSRLKMHAKAETKAAQRLGSDDLFYLCQEVIANRVAGVFMRFASGPTTNSVAWPQIKTLWEVQHWSPYNFARAFIRVNIVEPLNASLPSDQQLGIQVVGFPGQIVSTDSLTSTATSKTLTLSILRQLDFASSEDDAAPSKSPFDISPWMALAATTHTSHATLETLNDAWNKSMPYMTSADWKFLAGYDGSVVEFESHFDGFIRTNLTSQLLKRTHLLITTSTTRLSEQQREKRGLKIAIDTDTQTQSSAADAFQHDSISRGYMHQTIETGKIFTAAERPELARAIYEVGALSGLFYQHQTEHVEFTSMK